MRTGAAGRPTTRRRLGLNTDIQGKYVSLNQYHSGGITVAYGNEANTAISGQTVGLTPGASVNGDVIWRCGHGDNPTGWSAAAAATAATTNVAGKYLPSSCR